MTDVEINRIAILGFGEAGTALVQGLQQHSEAKLRVIDIACNAGNRGRAMQSRAAALGIDLQSGYDAALADAQLVISVVTGDDASAAAVMAREYLLPGTLYADFNSITGPQTCAVADQFAGTRVDFVDVAVMGSFKASGHRAPLLVSGAKAAQMVAFACAADIPARLLNEKVGDASAVKILRSIMMKGLEALSVECLVAARRQGLVQQLLDNVSDVDTIGFAKWMEVLTVTHLVHAERRMQEVDKAIENLHETGMTSLMSDATRTSHQRTVDAGLDPTEVADIDLDAALELLDQRICKP